MNQTTTAGGVTLRPVYFHDFNDPEMYSVLERWMEAPALGSVAVFRDLEGGFERDGRITEIYPGHGDSTCLVVCAEPVGDFRRVRPPRPLHPGPRRR